MPDPDTDSKKGLTQEEAGRRLESQGENILKKGKEKNFWDMVQEQINDPMIFILFVAAAISMLLREFSEYGDHSGGDPSEYGCRCVSGRKSSESYGSAEEDHCSGSPCEKRRGVPEDPGGPSGKGGPGEGRGRRSGAGRYPASQGKGTVRRRICAYGGIPPCAEVLPAFTARSACGGEAEHAFYVFSDHERQRRRDRYRNRNGYRTGEDRSYDQPGHRGTHSSSEEAGGSGENPEHYRCGILSGLICAGGCSSTGICSRCSFWRFLWL